MPEPNKGRPPRLNGLGQKLRKKSWSVYDDQVEYVNANGGSKLIRELIDKRRGRALLKSTA